MFGGIVVNADLYLNTPRGSNNKLNEVSDNVRNDNRLFDSQNNAAAGYQVGYVLLLQSHCFVDC